MPPVQSGLHAHGKHRYCPTRHACPLPEHRLIDPQVGGGLSKGHPRPPGQGYRLGLELLGVGLPVFWLRRLAVGGTGHGGHPRGVFPLIRRSSKPGEDQGVPSPRERSMMIRRAGAPIPRKVTSLLATSSGSRDPAGCEVSSSAKESFILGFEPVFSTGKASLVDSDCPGPWHRECG